MKKYISLLLVALMMFAVLFVSVSCKEEVPADRSASWDAATKAEHCDPILPAGSVSLNGGSFSIPMNWSTDDRGVKNLPDVTYTFSGKVDSTTNVSKALKEAVLNTPQSFFDEKPKNIIFLFSDGWGVTEVNASREYKGELILDYLPYATESKTNSYKQYDFSSYGNNSTNKNYSSSTTTDSCAGGTQVLTGYKTRYGYIGLDVDANPVMNLIEAAMDKGWKTADVTNDNILDATPSDAVIHDTNRYHEAVLVYKMFRYALVENGLDLLMGWDWYTSQITGGGTIAERLKSLEVKGIDQAIKRQSITNKAHTDPIAYFKGLSNDHKYKMAPFSVYYTLYEYEDPEHRRNVFMEWPKRETKKTTAEGETVDKTEAEIEEEIATEIATKYKDKTADERAALVADELAALAEAQAKLDDYIDWLDNANDHATSGLAAAVAEVESVLSSNPSSKVNQVTTLKAAVTNTDFSKPILASWDSSGNEYDSSKPNRGYLLSGNSVGKKYPSWPEMVAYTLYQMDKEADEDNDSGFFCIIENTCTDGWGHAQKPIEMMNEVQCFDEGVAIAVKYVLEHPDTLLVVSADHETGGIVLREGWEDDISQMKSTTSSHSPQNVPLYAFGAGAQYFSASSIKERFGSNPKAGVELEGKVHEGWITGALMGELITGEPFGLTNDTEDKGVAFTTKSNTPSGKRLWESTITKK